MKNSTGFESEIISTALGMIPAPPVDLYQLAWKLKVSDVRATAFRSGFTDFNSPAPIIYLNNTEPGARIRFVFAHELAHVMLRLPRVLRLIRMRGLAYLLCDQESLADRIATTLLIPDRWIEDFRYVPDKLARVQEFTSQANVPVTMMVTRLALTGIDIALLHWKKGNGMWHVVDRPGAPVSLHGFIRPLSDANYMLDNLQVPITEVDIDCDINGRLARIYGIGYRQNGHVFHFLEPSRDVCFYTVPQSKFGDDVQIPNVIREGSIAGVRNESVFDRGQGLPQVQGVETPSLSAGQQDDRSDSRTEVRQHRSTRRRTPAHAKKSRLMTWPITQTRTAAS